MYDTIFMKPEPKREYKLNLEFNWPTVVKQKVIPDNNNIEVYQQNLGIMKGDVKLFNYVGGKIMRHRQDDFKY
jgi:hypothetical protein